jgi:hypothetical protein
VLALRRIHYNKRQYIRALTEEHIVIRLKSIDYSERIGRDLEWSLNGLVLGPVNLIVGKNATGKTRVLNIIGNLARRTLREGRPVSEAGYDVTFDNNGEEIRYSYFAEESKAVRETVLVSGEVKLNRGPKTLSIYAEGLRNFMDFEPTENEVSAAVRKDAIQHRFLLPMHEWARTVRHYHFGALLGKQHIVMQVESSASGDNKFDDDDEDAVISIFEKGRRELGTPYVNAVISDMAFIGYDISDLSVSKPPHIKFQSNVPVKGRVAALGFRESGIRGIVYQDAASHGMFRALSIFAQVNYSQMAKRASCILIDDIGEGLDFERSARMIELLRNKAIESKFQLIMTTNDQFVMNHVPLEEWSLLQRNGCHVTVRNIHNSRDKFEEFKFVGLSNFSFFELDFIDAQPQEVGSNA